MAEIDRRNAIIFQHLKIYSTKLKMSHLSNKSKLGSILKVGHEIRASRFVEIQQLFHHIRNGVNEVYNFGKELEMIKEKNLLNYLNGLEKSVDEIKDEKAICEFLNSEKKECSAKLIRATIKKDGQDVKYYQSAINNILEPLYNYWRSELDFKTNFGTVKEISSGKNLVESEITDVTVANKINIKTKIIEPEKSIPLIELIPHLPPEFLQIAIKDLSGETILHYFMILATEKNNINNEPYMTKQDVIELVKKNFSVFKSQPTGKYFTINLNNNQKIRLRYFIQQFYQKFERNPQGNKMKYVNFLIYNFDLFKDDKPGSLYKNMGSAKKPIPENIIPVAKYFSK